MQTFTDHASTATQYLPQHAWFLTCTYGRYQKFAALSECLEFVRDFINDDRNDLPYLKGAESLDEAIDRVRDRCLVEGRAEGVKPNEFPWWSITHHSLVSP